MNYADIKTIDVQDGEGIRVSIYVSGCHFHCKGCHNKEAWDFNYGKKFDESTIDYIIELMNHDYIAGLSILGGEPMELINQQGLLPLVKKVKQKFPDKTIWCYTGYDFQKDVYGKMYKEYPYTKELLENIDIMVDGEFEENKKIVDLKFRGSINQKKIDVKASLKEGKTIQLKFGDESRYVDKDGNIKSPKIAVFKKFEIERESREIAEEETTTVMSGTISGNIINPEILNYQEQEIEEKIAASGIENENKNNKNL